MPLRSFDLHATPDGYVVRYGDLGAEAPVAEFTSFAAASAGCHLARQALALLDLTLARKDA